MPSLPLPPIPLAQCDLGPNYGQLIRLTGITSSISQIAANTYTSLTGYTYALQNLSPPVTNAVNGLPLDVLQDKVQLVYASSSVYYGWSDCEVDHTQVKPNVNYHVVQQQHGTVLIQHNTNQYVEVKHILV